MKKIIFLIIICIFITGCYKQDYEKQKIETMTCNENVKILERNIEILNTRRCPECKPEIIYEDRIINNCTIRNEEIIRYSTRIKELEYYLSQMNDSTTYHSMKYNLTNCESRYKQLNESLHIIKEELKRLN